MNAEIPNDPETRHGKTNLRERIAHGLDLARQMMQPAAFRIAAPCAYEGPPPSGADADAPDGKGASIDAQLSLALRTLSTVATAVWRAKTKLDSESRAELPDGLRNVPRHVQAAWDALAAGCVQIDDPTGQRYVPGMAVNVLTFQPMEGIGSEIIHETVKPSVYFDNRLIQRADVIVARPVTQTDKPQPNDMLPEGVLGQNNTPNEKGTSADDPDND
jgi:hypothetical protein